ncbi:MAG: NAD(P)/FAD-dependent oxidoreductase [Deltaproteobacteria bacterium]|nr:NAD(P)/FAD-dependent oxidoreductase [Deltaproteobacteria bacterium]
MGSGDKLWDVLVAGGGPVGLYAAIEAARAGLDTAVLEARPGVLDKACGEGLMPAAVAALQRAGVRIQRKHCFAGIRYVEGGSCAEGRFNDGVGWGIRRTELHRALRERAGEVGVKILQHRVAEVSDDRDAVVVDGRRARYLIAADGLRSPLRRSLHLEAPPKYAPRYALRRHFRVQPWGPFVEVHWHDLGEAYVTPVASDEVGVALLFDDRSRTHGDGDFEVILARFPVLAARLAQATATSAVRGAGPCEQRSRRVVDGRVLLVGDAAGALDPITGEGLRLGFLASIAAVDAIVGGRVPQYETEWRRLTRRYWWMTSALLALRRSPLRPLMMPTLCHLPAVFDRILGELGEQPVALARV